MTPRRSFATALLSLFGMQSAPPPPVVTTLRPHLFRFVVTAGAPATFTIQPPPPNSSPLMVFRNGLLVTPQEFAVAAGASSAALSLTGASAGDVVTVYYLA